MWILINPVLFKIHFAVNILSKAFPVKSNFLYVISLNISVLIIFTNFRLFIP